MGLYEVLKGIPLPVTDPEYDERDARKLPALAFAAALRQMAKGIFTKPQVVAAFGLTASEQSDLNALIVAGSTADDVQDAALLIERGYVTKAQAKAILGL